MLVNTDFANNQEDILRSTRINKTPVRIADYNLDCEAHNVNTFIDNIPENFEAAKKELTMQRYKTEFSEN